MTDLSADPTTIFKHNIHQYHEEYLAYRKQDRFYSWLRVIVFISVLFLSGFFLFNGPLWLGVGVLLAGILLFGLVVNRHRQVAFETRQRRILQTINEEEVRRLEGDLSGFDQGTSFADPEHAYTGDLDIFGRNSLFQLLNRTTTLTGQHTLAQWLKEAVPVKKLRERQEAVKELSGKLAWNQNFIAIPRHKDHTAEGGELHVFKQWVTHSADRNLRYWQIMAYLLGVIGLGVMGLVMSSMVEWFYLFIPMIFGMLAIRDLQTGISHDMEISRIGLHLMESYLLMLDRLKEEDWESDLIRQKLKRLEEPVSAKGEIGKLKRMFHTLAGRANPFFAMLNVYFGIDIYLMIRLEKWKQLNGEHFHHWIEALSELEALSGLSAYAHANPEHSVPEFREGEYYLSAVDLGHPLISKGERVCNHFEMKNRGAVGVITGSNMSGKSTFLRTIGINLTLAQAGAPVCAKALTMMPLSVFTSMRTADNLEESVSSFYAELRRLERLIQSIESDVPVFFMLDEILKGTNTRDRQLGARSLIRQLSQGNAMGLVSTHDISLGEMAEAMPDVTNWHFSSEVHDDDLTFDYRLKEGVCQSFNASQLMAKIGIRLEQDHENDRV